MKKLTASLLALLATASVQARTTTITIKNAEANQYQRVTGFGAACCDGAMCPFGSDTTPVSLLYGKSSKVGLNIMRMEISPNFKGDISYSDIGWDTPYDWHGSLPSAKIVKNRGGIVFGTPWSPPGEYKTNGTAQGGKSDKQGNQRGQLREDCYEKFFPWMNSFLKYMKDNGVKVDAVSVQNEPDWWVDYSGCLYTAQQQLNLVKNYAHMLDRETYPGVRLISAEPLGFDPDYSNTLLNDPVAREQIDIIAGHLYGHPPLKNEKGEDGNMKKAAVLAAKYGKEVWMTEHSVTDYLQDRLPSWPEQLQFAEELNECMVAGCTGYIYWYMRAHWAFVGTGETKYGTANKKNQLLPRAYVMSHFSKYVTGARRIYASATGFTTPSFEAPFETSAYQKGDSIIVMTINTTGYPYDIRFKFPEKVKEATHILSTGNETKELCQKTDISLETPAQDATITVPLRSLSTFVFMISHEEEQEPSEETAILSPTAPGASRYYDLSGHRLAQPRRGINIQQRPDGKYRMILKK